jgi:hypothetical protein
MRYEAMRLMQFVFSLSLILLAFLAGLLVGRRRSRPRGPVDHTLAMAPHQATPAGRARPSHSVRPDLFAPELGSLAGTVDLTEPSSGRLVLPPGATFSRSPGTDAVSDARVESDGPRR